MEIQNQIVLCACIGIFLVSGYHNVVRGEALRAATEKAPRWQYVPLRTAAQKAKGYTGGEMGQMAFTIAISPSNPNYLAVGIDTAATYVSTNGGKSWSLRRRGIVSNGVQSVAFDPRNPRVLWAAGLRSAAGTPGAGVPDKKDLPKYSDPKADGIYRSTDAGESWQLLRNAVFLRCQAQNEYFAFDPGSFDGSQCNTVYAATHWDGLLKTTDAGRSWHSLGLEKTHINAVILHAKNNRLLFVAANAGIFRSDNAGESFEEIGTGLAAAPVYGLALHSKEENVLYVALGKQGVWRSDDGGRTFKPRGQGLPKHDWRRLAISPVNPRNLYVDADMVGGNTHLCWSHDGGARWRPVEQVEPGFQGSSYYWAEGIVAHPTDPNVAFHLYPVRKTTDGGRTWQYSSDGISGFRRSTRTSIAFRPDDRRKMVFFFLDHGSTLTTDGGDTFTYVPPPRQRQLGAMSTAVGAYDPTPGSRKLISAVGGWTRQVICISEDDGKSWSVQPDTVGGYRFLAFHPQKPDIVYAGRANDTLRSRDGGKSWQTIRHPIKAMFLGNGDVVFASRRADEKGWANEVLKSTDSGDTWQVLPGQVTGSIGEMDVDPQDSNRLYAASHAGVWVFDGKGWTVRNDRHGLEKDFFDGLPFQKIAVDPVHPNIIYTGGHHAWRGTAKGIFRSTDYGEHWENITGNLGPDLTVWAITVSPHDGTVWLGTDYGNWKLPPPEGSRRFRIRPHGTNRAAPVLVGLRTGRRSRPSIGTATDPTAEHGEAIRGAREKALKGNYEDAATAIDDIQSRNGREVLDRIARGFRAAGEMREWIIQGVSKKPGEKVLLKVMGRRSRVTILAADTHGIEVKALGRTTPMPWKQLAPEELLRISRKYISDPAGRISPEQQALLDDFALACGLRE